MEFVTFIRNEMRKNLVIINEIFVEIIVKCGYN